MGNKQTGVTEKNGERNERLDDGREERVLKVNGKCVLL